MFGFKTKTPDPVVEPAAAGTPLGIETFDVIELVRPKKLTDRPEPIPEIDKYMALAEELKTGAILRGRVLQKLAADLLWERGVEMYSYDDVDAYLKERAGKVVIINTSERVSTYRWRPLRDCDGEKEWGWEHDLTKGGYFWKDRWECRTYSKVVPFDVLESVKALEEKFPGRLHFFVSDIEADPDPFIVACARDTGKIVFGAWDEPEFFRDGTQPK